MRLASTRPHRAFAATETDGLYLYTAPEWPAHRLQLSRRRMARVVPLAANVSALKVSPQELQGAIVLFYSLLDEQQRRFFAGLESIRLGHGGDTLLADFLGPKNSGATWLPSPRLVNDHDFRSNSIGVAIRFGIYDPVGNHGSVVVGVSHDTSAFAVHAITHWWQRKGLLDYFGSRQLLMLADTGGSNGYRCRAWKTELQTHLADTFNRVITLAHYPTGASKWNPIEHRLFSEISKNWAGEPLDSYHKILSFIRTTSTQTGLDVSACLDRRNHPTGVEPTPEQLPHLRLRPHQTLPPWNYTIQPNL